MRVLIACERSGVVRRPFEHYGHDAWSCDIEPAYDPSNRHIRGNVLDHLDDGWDLLAVMHPRCTILCNSSVTGLYIGGRKVNGPDPTRWAELASFYTVPASINAAFVLLDRRHDIADLARPIRDRTSRPRRRIQVLGVQQSIMRAMNDNFGTPLAASEAEEEERRQRRKPR